MAADKGVIGKMFRKEAGPLLAWLAALPGPQAEELQARLEQDKYAQHV